MFEGEGVRDEVIQIWRAGHFSLHIGGALRSVQMPTRGEEQNCIFQYISCKCHVYRKNL